MSHNVSTNIHYKEDEGLYADVMTLDGWENSYVLRIGSKFADGIDRPADVNLFVTMEQLTRLQFHLATCIHELLEEA